MMKTAIVTGATGQDGSYLCRSLLDKGYRVFAARRRSSRADRWRWRYLDLDDNENLVEIDYEIGDICSVIRTIERCEPDEIYNLAAHTFVGSSFEQPVSATTTNTLGNVQLLEAVRTVDRNIRFYQASSAEMFGKVQAVPQTETTPFYPRSPYGVSKLFGHWMAVNYRESYGLFACSGILFNHESPLRGPEFVTRKISQAVARIRYGSERPLSLGNLDARRDWGYAGDYVDGMWRMLQAPSPGDYVLATGRTETVRAFVDMAFAVAGMTLRWDGSGLQERAYLPERREPVVVIDPALFRPAEVDHLVGSPAKAEAALGWRPTTGLEQLCTMMVEADLLRTYGVEPSARPRPTITDRGGLDLTHAQGAALNGREHSPLQDAAVAPVLYN
jgi:GDPmannose 4,6-dehydratase